MTVSPALAKALAAGRPQFNARIAAARRARSGLDMDAVARTIREWLGPVATAVEAAAPDRTGAVVEAGFDLCLGLAGQGLAGERRAVVDQVWREVAVACAAAVAERPFATLAMLTNAALTIDATPGARATDWIARMTAIAPMITADTLAAAGQVVAWRSGMAHFRDGALSAADGLPEPLALAAIGARGAWSDVRAALTANIWWTPDGDAAEGIGFGGFTGFGGPFAEPPQVRTCDQGFLVRSGARTGLIVADAWGATLHPASPDEFDGAAAARSSEGAAIVAADRTIAVDLPPEGLAFAVNAHSVAVASPYSHHLRIVPWRLP
jgi:hypothetical protein